MFLKFVKFGVLIAQGKKMCLSMFVQPVMQLYRLPEGRRINRFPSRWEGIAFYHMTSPNELAFDVVITISNVVITISKELDL